MVAARPENRAELSVVLNVGPDEDDVKDWLAWAILRNDSFRQPATAR